MENSENMIGYLIDKNTGEKIKTINLDKTGNKIEENKHTWDDVFTKYNLDNLEYNTTKTSTWSVNTQITYDGSLYF